MNRRDHRDGEVPHGHRPGRIEDVDLLLRHLSSPGHIGRGLRSEDVRMAVIGDIGNVHHVVVMGMGHEDPPETGEIKALQDRIRHGGIRLHGPHDIS